MARRAMLVVNRHSRRGRENLDAVRKRLVAGGLELAEFDLPRAPLAGSLIASRGGDFDLVVVGGGDGTLNAVLDGILAAGRPLGVLPLGTGNDFARTMGIPEDPEAAAGVIVDGRPRRVDLGVVNGHPFLNVASIGLSVQVARELTRDLKRRWGRLGYALGAWRALRSVRPLEATIHCDGHALRLRTVQVAVGNGRHFGAGMVVAEDAAPDDGKLDLFAVQPCGLMGYAGLLPLLKRGRQGRLSNVATCRARLIEVLTAVPVPVNADGELITRTPARFQVLPRALTVLAPAAEGGG